MTKTIDFAKFSSIKIGGVHEVTLLEDPSDFSDDYFLIGSCNNVIVGDKPPKLMKLSKKYDYIKIEDDLLKVGAATPSGKLASYCKKNNIANFEFASQLPGTLGGLVYMNAGLKEYEIFNNLISVTTTKGEFKKSEINYGYRTTDIKEPILEVSFTLSYGYSDEKREFFKDMRSNQPSEASAGSCFKNPKGDFAGRLIEAVGLKGERVGAMQFSTKHANFLLNSGGGVFEDAIALIEEAQRRVLQEFGISLECEVIILDERWLKTKH